jgi:hypothetical protein
VVRVPPWNTFDRPVGDRRPVGEDASAPRPDNVIALATRQRVVRAEEAEPPELLVRAATEISWRIAPPETHPSGSRVVARWGQGAAGDEPW